MWCSTVADLEWAWKSCECDFYFFFLKKELFYLRLRERKYKYQIHNTFKDGLQKVLFVSTFSFFICHHVSDICVEDSRSGSSDQFIVW